MALPNTEAKKVRVFTEANERVFVHPASVNFAVTSFPSPFLLFLHKFQTNKTYILDSGMVTPLMLFFSCGVVEVIHERCVAVLDGWLCVEAVGRVGVLLNELKKELSILLAAKVRSPDMDVCCSEVPAVLRELLEKEEIERFGAL